MNNTPLTEQQKQEIYELYLDPNNKVAEIASTYGVHPSTVVNTAAKLGATPRQPKSGYTPRSGKAITIKRCPNCKTAIEIKGARFCHMCGSDIRSPKELLVERIRGAVAWVKYLPEAHRDNMQKLLLDVVKALDEESK